jgi:hypothetical protein
MEAYRIEAQFARCLVKQKERGFLVDPELIRKHIRELTRWIDLVDKKALPQLPLRIKIKEKKKNGEYGWLKKPFKTNGERGQYCLDYIDDNYSTCPDIICGPFSRIGFEQMDLGSGAQVKEYLLSVGWVPDQWNFNKETKERTSPKLSKDDSFIGVEGSAGKLVASRMIFRHRRSQLQGLLKIIRHDGRITADVTGLCPTARIKHKGIVNIPGADAKFGNQMREVFIAAKGYNIVGCDAASCQLRMLAHYMGDADYTEAVLNGKSSDGTDIHSVNMRIAGLTKRSDAKTLIYAILFGAGNAKLAAQLGVSQREAKRIRDRFLKGLPRLQALVKSLKNVWKQRGYILGLDGRKIFVRSEHMLLVYLLQSAEAIMMKVATCYADMWITKGGYDAHMVAHVHDEYQWEVIQSESKKVASLLEDAIVKAGEYLKLTVPMAGEADIGMNWKETH